VLSTCTAGRRPPLAGDRGVLRAASLPAGTYVVRQHSPPDELETRHCAPRKLGWCMRASSPSPTVTKIARSAPRVGGGSGLSAVKPAVEKLVGEDRDVPSNPAPCGHARRLATHASAFSTDRSRPPKPKLNANWRRAVAAPTGGAQRPGYAPAASRPGTTHYDCSTGGPTRCPSSGRRRRTGRTSVG